MKSETYVAIFSIGWTDQNTFSFSYTMLSTKACECTLWTAIWTSHTKCTLYHTHQVHTVPCGQPLGPHTPSTHCTFDGDGFLGRVQPTDIVNDAAHPVAAIGEQPQVREWALGRADLAFQTSQVIAYKKVHTHHVIHTTCTPAPTHSTHTHLPHSLP